ncbi:MAG: glycosyltransferase, partial [Duncaniella sp.]|nr:glycosyltransferase [Duncaniella sp.]
PGRKEQVTVVHHEKTQGLAGARLTGLKHARGKYIIVCDSDDWVEPEMYGEMLKAAEASDADMVVCQYFVNFPESEKVFKQDLTEDHDEFLRRVIDGEIHCGLWNKMVKRELYEKLSPSFITGVNMWEDVSVLPRLVHLAKKIVVIDTPYYHYAQLNPEAYTQKWNTKYSEQICEAIDVNLKYFSEHKINADKLAQRGLLSILLHETDENRTRYLEKFRARGVLDKIDYSSMSAYNRILGRLLFRGGGYFRIADLIIGLKAQLRKHRLC